MEFAALSSLDDTGPTWPNVMCTTLVTSTIVTLPFPTNVTFVLTREVTTRDFISSISGNS